MHDSSPKPGITPRRLCSEIQLFDLCDLTSCKQKDGRFCADSILLGRFEKIAEEELRAPERYVAGELDELDDGEENDDEFIMDNFEGGEEDGWEDEE